MAKKKSDPGYRLIEKTTRKLPHKLDQDERERLRDRENELGEKVLVLENEHKAKVLEKNEEARARRDGIKEARAAWAEAVEARKSGVELRERAVEVRAVIATQTIDTVVVKTGEVVESRPMNEEERRDYLQQALDIGGAANDEGQEAGHSEAAEAAPEGQEGEGGADTEGDTGADAAESDTLDDGEADALGLPHGWPKSWRGREWQVSVGKDKPKGILRENDVHEVFIRLRDAGTTLDELLEGWEGVQGMKSWIGRPLIARALSLLKQKGLAVKLVIEGQPPAWAPAPREPAQEPEPGRTDTLPEAADPARPRRVEPKTKADALIADAVGVADLYEPAASPA